MLQFTGGTASLAGSQVPRALLLDVDPCVAVLMPPAIRLPGLLLQSATCWGHKAAEVCPLTALEARRLKSGCQQGGIPAEAPGEGLPAPLALEGLCGCGSITLISAPPPRDPHPCLCVFLLLLRTPVAGFGAPPSPILGCYLIYICNDPVPKKVTI